jgi:hypothetical protein
MELIKELEENFIKTVNTIQKDKLYENPKDIVRKIIIKPESLASDYLSGIADFLSFSHNHYSNTLYFY